LKIKLKGVSILIYAVEIIEDVKIFGNSGRVTELELFKRSKIAMIEVLSVQEGFYPRGYF